MTIKLSTYGLLVQVVFLGVIYAHSGKAQIKSADEILIEQGINGLTIAEVFDLIESNSDFKMHYIKRDLDNRVLIHLGSNSRRSVRDLLLEVSRQANLKFKQINNSISVSPILKQEAEHQIERVLILETVDISGKITDENGVGLPGASVVEKGTTNGTTTDLEGNYKLSASEDAILTISFIGYETQEIALAGRSSVDVQMSIDAMELDDIVVVGYGTQRRANVTSAISQVDADELTEFPVSGFDQALVGKMAGVQVLQTTGAPGGNVSIRVRGMGSITGGNNPLYVVDGVPLSNDIGNAESTTDSYESEINPLNSINTNDIESIEVLKDAAAAAIYGSRAANGVVLITTKRGSTGAPNISFNSSMTWQKVSKTVDMMDAYQFAELSRDGHNNAYLDAYGDAVSINDSNNARMKQNRWRTHYLIPDELQPYLSGTPGLTNTNWQDEIFRTAPMTSNSLSIAGGKDNVTYYLSGEYLDQEGIIINSGYKKYGSRLNLNIDHDKLKVGINMNPSHAVYNKVNGEGPFFDQGIVSTALTYNPIWPVYNADGSYNYGNNDWCCAHSNQINPVAQAELIHNELEQTRLLGNVYAEYNIWDNLNYKISLGTDINDYQYEYYRPSELEVTGTSGSSNPVARSRNTKYVNWVIEHTLAYNKSFGDHNISGLVGFTSQKETKKWNYLEATDFANDLVQTLNGGLVPEGGGGSAKSEWSLLSYLSRVQYDYKGKYLLTAAVRADGSSRFGADNKWGYFPSVSAGWRISEEAFFNNIEAISEVKMRSSYGITGNFQIPNYGSISLISSDNYVLGSTPSTVTGLRPSTLPNDELSWEKTAMIDLGIDIGLFKDKLMLTVDYYDSRTTDLLLDVLVPRTTGFDTGLRNLGEVSNKGWEFVLIHRNQIGKLSIDVTTNLSTNKNKVEALGPEGEPIIVSGGHSSGTFITQIGEPIGQYFTITQNGVFLNQEELDNSPHYSNANPGDFKYIDADGDAEIDRELDKVITGSYFPDFTYGLSAGLGYSGLDFSFSLQGSEGNEVMNLMKRHILNMEGNFNTMVEGLNRWVSESEPGDGQTVRANRRATGRNVDANNRLIEDGSYLRIRNIALGYTFPSSLVSKLNLTSFRLYVSSQNPFTFTDYSGFNPEVDTRPGNSLISGEDYGTYPLAKTLTIGANIKF